MYDYSILNDENYLCIDLKSFFASVSCIEKGLDPLKTKLAVVADTKRQGSVVLAATPRLKELGVKTGTRLFEIPHRSDIFIINPSMQKYIAISTKISKIALNYVAPSDFHQYSIDEFFMKVDGSYKLFEGTPQKLAKLIQTEIYNETNIMSTIGIGSNMLLSKLALDLEAKSTKKGIAEWRYKDVPNKLWHVKPLTKMWGINNRTKNKLNKKGIFSIGDLANYSVKFLKRDFGVIGVDLHLHANGIDNSIISQPHKPKDKSFGKSQILMRDYQLDELRTVLIEQVDEVYYRTRQKSLYPTSISIHIGYSDEGGLRKQFTNKSGYHSSYEIVNMFWQYIIKMLDKNRLYRTIGVSFGGFVPNKLKQLSLFDDPMQVKNEIIDSQLDVVRRKYGKDIVMKGSSLSSSGTLLDRKGLVAGHKK